MRITLLIEPSAERTVPFAAGTERYRRFTEELGQYAGTPVPIKKDFLRNALEDGYILFAGNGDLSRSLASCSPDRAAGLPSRIVLLDVGSQQALEELERHRLAAAVDSLRMSEWLARPSSRKGPFGLRYLAKSLGVCCASLPWFQSKHYCRLDSNRHLGMPHLLADYLAAYDRDQTPLTALPSVALARVPGEVTQEAANVERISSGREEVLAPTSQVEYVSTKRAVASLKRVRELAGISLPQVAEIAGVDPELLGLLDAGDYFRATLGTLRGYVFALERTWGWTLAESGQVVSPRSQSTGERSELVGTNDQPIIASDTDAGLASADMLASQIVPARRPNVKIEQGMTVYGNRRIRRREPEGELNKPSARRRKEESYAGV